MSDETFPSDSTLARAPERALSFLHGLARSPQIFTLMSARGYTEDDQKEGWALLNAILELPKVKLVTDRSVRDAIVALDNWDEPWMNTARAALRRLHKPQHDAVFQDLAPSTGPAAVLGVKLFLDRLNALELGSDDDRAALDTLARRGLNKDERDRAAALVQKATSLPNHNNHEELATLADDQRVKLKALHDWWTDWSQVARTHIKRRNYLITLGLAARTTARPDSSLEEP
jgi:hypothetical protein